MSIKLKPIKTRVRAAEIPQDVTELVLPNLWPPNFEVSPEQMPEVKDWEVGEKYTMLIRVRMTGKREDKHKSSADFEILAYRPKSNVKNMSDEEFEKYQAKELTGK